MAIETASPLEIAARARPALAVATRSAPAFERVRVDGKQFLVGDARFVFRGVTYGTFAERADGANFPEGPRLRSDLKAIAESGFTVVRTYTPPPPDMLDIASELGLRVLAGLNYQDWRYIVGRRTGDNGSIRRAARESAARGGDRAVPLQCLGQVSRLEKGRPDS